MKEKRKIHKRNIFEIHSKIIRVNKAQLYIKKKKTQSFLRFKSLSKEKNMS